MGQVRVEKGLGHVPVEFERLMKTVLEDDALKSEISDLVERKRKESELGSEPRIRLLHDFIEQELDRHKEENSPDMLPGIPVEKMNNLFRETLEEVWGFSNDS